MRAGIGAVSLLLAALVLEPGAWRQAQAAPQLRGVDGLVRAYDSILEARFDQVDAELRRACPPAPLQACDVMAATALWWRIQLDSGSRALDVEFSSAADRSIASTEAWTEREPDNPEAWFYLGGAYAGRVQWLVLRDEKIAAARDGKRIHQALERALELDPGLEDAHFALGMYRYYADIAPAAAKVVRFFLLLPGGDKKLGLEQMLRARARGRLLQGEADYQLHIIYLWYEQQTARALNILESLRQHYPGNPLFLAETARIQDEYLHDTTASLDSWRALLAASREQRSNAPLLAETKARLAIARLLDLLHQTDQSIEQLEAVVALRPPAPYGSLPLAYLRLGEAHDRLGARASALQAYRSASALVSSPDLDKIKSRVTERTRRAVDPRRSAAYRLSLEGWRRLEQNDVDAAAVALERSLELHANDPVAHYRFGRVLQAKKNDPAALAQFENAIRGAKNCPPPILGTAYVEAARVLERAGRRDQAISYYRIAAALFGASADTRSSATRALTRLRTSGAPAPRD
ncbi:MAG: tetratricopeptide repeat protein [Vicinamibacterales bacterium]